MIYGVAYNVKRIHINVRLDAIRNLETRHARNNFIIDFLCHSFNTSETYMEFLLTLLQCLL